MRIAAVAGMIGFLVLVAAIGGYFFLQWAGQYVTRTVFVGSGVEVSEYMFNTNGIRLEFKSTPLPIVVGLKTVSLYGENPIQVRQQGRALLVKLNAYLGSGSSGIRADMWWRFDTSSSELAGCTKYERGSSEDECAAFAAQMP